MPGQVHGGAGAAPEHAHHVVGLQIPFGAVAAQRLAVRVLARREGQGRGPLPHLQRVRPNVQSVMRNDVPAFCAVPQAPPLPKLTDDTRVEQRA